MAPCHTQQQWRKPRPTEGQDLPATRKTCASEIPLPRRAEGKSGLCLFQDFAPCSRQPTVIATSHQRSSSTIDLAKLTERADERSTTRPGMLRPRTVTGTRAAGERLTASCGSSSLWVLFASYSYLLSTVVVTCFGRYKYLRSFRRDRSGFSHHVPAKGSCAPNEQEVGAIRARGRFARAGKVELVGAVNATRDKASVLLGTPGGVDLLLQYSTAVLYCIISS